MLLGNPPRRSARQERQTRTEAFGCAAQNVLDVLAKARIETADLRRQRDFYPRQFSRNRFQQLQEIGARTCRKRNTSAQCRPQHSVLTVRATRKGVNPEAPDCRCSSLLTAPLPESKMQGVRSAVSTCYWDQSVSLLIMLRNALLIIVLL